MSSKTLHDALVSLFWVSVLILVLRKKLLLGLVLFLGWFGGSLTVSVAQDSEGSPSETTDPETWILTPDAWPRCN